MDAYGILETYGLIASIEALDTMLKSSNVSFVSKHCIGSGLVTIIVSGDVSSVQSAIQIAYVSASKLGTVKSSHVIPRPEKSVANMLLGNSISKDIKLLVDTNTSIDIDINKTKEIVTEEVIQVKSLDNIKIIESNTKRDEFDLNSDFHKNLYKMSLKELRIIATKMTEFDSDSKTIKFSSKKMLIDLIIKKGGNKNDI